MKLLARYSRINLLITTSIFIISGVVYYILLSLIIVGQVDEDLKIEEAEIRTYLYRYHQLPASISVNDQMINYSVVDNPFIKRTITTANIIDIGKSTPEQFRQLIFGLQVNGKYYKVIVSKSLEDTDALIRSVLLVTFFTIMSILLASFILNRIVVKNLWKPFYSTLDYVRQFKLGKSVHFHLPSSKIDEFNFMNLTIQLLIQQAQKDYQGLKTFSENASHEIQTPLAVIRSKLDLLIQDDSISHSQSRLLQSIYLSLEKLTKLNSSLLLLTKIENNQYSEKKVVDINAAISEKLNDFQELWQSQKISISATLGKARININPELLEILLNNLFSNSTRYNFTGGRIGIELNYEQLKVSNTSKIPRLPSTHMFQRFYKSQQGGNDTNSLGLGLSIIRQICQNSGFTIDYFFQNGEHIFIIRWS